MRHVPSPFLLVLLLCGCGCGCAAPFQATRDFSFNLPWEEYERLTIETRNGAITVRTAEISDVYVSGRLRANGATLEQAQQRLDAIEVAARTVPGPPATLRVDVTCSEPPPHYNFGADIVIEVPRPCAVVADTGNGSVVVEHALDVDADTSNGAIRLKQIDGAVQAKTSNGSIVLRDISGNVHVDSSNGNIVARDIGGDCIATTSNGSIECVATPSMRGRVDLRSSNGSVRVVVPAELAADVRLRTSNGRVRVDLGDAELRDVETGKYTFAARMNGGGPILEATTSNGSVTLETQ